MVLSAVFQLHLSNIKYGEAELLVFEIYWLVPRMRHSWNISVSEFLSCIILFVHHSL